MELIDSSIPVGSFSSFEQRILRAVVLSEDEFERMLNYDVEQYLQEYPEDLIFDYMRGTDYTERLSMQEFSDEDIEFLMKSSIIYEDFLDDTPILEESEKKKRRSFRKSLRNRITRIKRFFRFN